MKTLTLFASLAITGLAFAGVPKVIFDSDMYTDFDDVGALAVLHSLADAGECEILGTISCTAGGSYSTGMIELINRFYGRPDLPIAAPKTMGVNPEQDRHAFGNRTFKIYASMVKAHPELRYPTTATAPDANETYRRLLAAAPDGSVTIISVGFITNMRRLLETKGDAISPLDGRALVSKKVKAWYAMACRFPNGFEYNSGVDAASSTIAFREWPSPIYFLDWGYGVDVRCGVPASKLNAPANPVCEVFTRALRDYHEENRGHSAWDEVTVLAAVRGWQSHFGVERGRFDMVFPNGHNCWTKCADGSHHVLTVKTPKAEVGRIVDELIARGPAKK